MSSTESPGTSDHPEAPAPQGLLSATSKDWAVLFYLCGHFNRPGERDPFVTAIEEVRTIGASAGMSAAAYLDLESGAQRVALRPGEPVETEFIGAANSGAPQTLEQFLTWAFDSCPARRYILVMAGLGILDTDSVVGRPPFDSSRTFAICDDRATGDALELHELGATLRTAFPPDGSRRLVLLACDMYAMQFMEVAYELRGILDLLVGIQPDERADAGSLRHWPYPRLLKRWQEVVAAPPSGPPRWRTGVDPVGLTLASETVSLLAEHYTACGLAEPVTVSALNLQALVPLAQALDTFSVVYLQWLSNDVIWRAREQVVRSHQRMLEQSWSYDLDDVARAICAALDHAAAEALARWAASSLPSMPYAQLSRALRILGGSARELARARDDEIFRDLADEIAACRSSVERIIAVSASDASGQTAPPSQRDLDQAVRRLFISPGDDDDVRAPGAWHAIIAAARDRFAATPTRELFDAFDGIEAAEQLGRLAQRVSDLTRTADAGQHPAVAAVWPPGGRCGLALYRPLDLDRLAESNYLHLRFSRELHWTALLTAVDLIKNHARMLWRLVESQLTAAPLEARYQLMRRLAGARALTGRHAGQLRALSAPEAVFLTIQLDGGDPVPGDRRRAADSHDPVVSYCVRLSSLDRSTTAIERRNFVTRARLERVLAEIDQIGSDVDAPADRTLARLSRCGSLLGDDMLYGISEHLAGIQTSGDRDVHLVLQMPRELMRFPWELLRDRNGWLVERFALGRQLIADADAAPKWASSRRNGPIRLLVVAPSIEGEGVELAGVGVLEGAHVADCFERLEQRLPGLVEPGDFHEYVGQTVTVEQFRSLLRERRYDVVHFAGHGRYDPQQPERSSWIFSDGPLYAFELRHTLANAEVTPWLIYGSACEGARDGSAGGGAGGGYHDGVYGMASAALGHGVAAYVGPLWRISEADAKNLAAAFYEALLLRRTSLGEALALARRSVRDGQPDLDNLVTAAQHRAGGRPDGRPPRSAGWTGMVLYGDPTPTVMQRLSPSDVGAWGTPDQSVDGAGRDEAEPFGASSEATLW